MHILAFEGWPTLLAGGQERSLFEVLSGLRRNSFDITLAYERNGELLPVYEEMGIRTVKILSRTLVLKSLRSPLSIFNFVRSLSRLLAESRSTRSKWTLIYINQYFDVTLAAICGAILKIPVVCHLRLAAPPYMSRQFRWGLNRCELLICNSHYTAKTYIDAGIRVDTINVVLNAIDTDRFSPPGRFETAMLAQRARKQVLYVGRIAPEKGLEILIEAVRLARIDDPRITLLVVGNPIGFERTAQYLDGLHRVAREKLGTAVEFRPATPDVVALYRDADLTVLPAVWEEPFGRVVIESMACGVPCLASRVGGIPEILRDDCAGLLFERSAPGELSARIREYIDWRTDNAELSTVCRERVLKNFNSVPMTNRLLHLFQRAQCRAN
jgi:glycosyltransferase involved in cell wall biosynthesis